jgi:outer membrane receptor protein involved in Fe transport
MPTACIRACGLVALWAVMLGAAHAQQALHGVVVDASGAAVAAATVQVRGHDGARATTDPAGAFHLDLVSVPLTLVVTAAGFADALVAIDARASLPLRIVLQPRGISERVTVSASGGRRLSTAASVTVLDAAAVAAAPALTLDDQLRSLPGFSLFRRSSSRVANPTTQGVTLRGLAASGSSRAAVLADDAPLTDPFGGWVHWMRIPAAAIDRVEVARGAASDTFGSDAIGGAIRVDLARSGLRVFADAGQQATARLSVFGGRRIGPGAVRGGAERFTTDGFVTVAPEDRGPIDIPASSHHTSVSGGARLPAQAASHVDLRGGYVTERRGNGTPFQANATTVRHGSTTLARGFGDAWLSVRVHGTSQDYDQTFSVVAPDRASERPTTAQRVGTSSAGFSVEWLQPWRRALLLVSGSGREVRADISERSVAGPEARADITDATERSGAVAAQLSYPLNERLSLFAGARADVWRTSRIGEESDAHLRVGPRVAVAWQATDAVTVRAAFQSGYRFPTLNELFRGFRVGSVLTSANPRLRPEQSAGLEGSALLRTRRLSGRLSAFWTRVDDAIVNVTVAQGPEAIVRERRNAAEVLARGLEAEAELRLTPGLAATGTLAWIESTFDDSAELGGLRVPQVPRFQAAAGLRAAWRAFMAAADVRFSGRQFDDDRNRFVLDPAALLDVRGGIAVSRGIDIFVAVENVFDEDQDVGRTPLRTIGVPRSVRAGLRLLR